MKQAQKQLVIKRYDSSNDQSLRPYSAADEYLLSEFNSLEKKPTELAIYHDRFSYLSCSLHAFNPLFIYTNKSQLNALELNTVLNKLNVPRSSNPLSTLENQVSLAMIKIPKSLALFELYLNHISQNSTDNVEVFAGFMTRHFSSKMIKIAEKYFDSVEQSKAVKKARILILSGKRKVAKSDCINLIEFNNATYRQYWGVFSTKHIDYATQFLLEHIELKASDDVILDLASGNGIIGNEILKSAPKAKIHLIDDSYLAVESAKINIHGDFITHHFNDNLSDFEEGFFDLIASNPPFHFEHEINIQIPIQLFKECYRCLKPSGTMQLVANNHLNYATHLNSIFPKVDVLAKNDKFVIYKCYKSSS